jgi:hypothetical protein
LLEAFGMSADQTGRSNRAAGFALSRASVSRKEKGDPRLTTALSE